MTVSRRRARACWRISRYYSLPAGVGVVQELDLLASHGIAIILVLALSVVVTLLATVLTFRLVSRLLKQQDAR
ncbi:putative effector of murein hydrolase LrgA (UPF0299 family) [Bradyrhizobium liaoningense]